MQSMKTRFCFLRKEICGIFPLAFMCGLVLMMSLALSAFFTMITPPFH